jgi:hypothetical protein
MSLPSATNNYATTVYWRQYAAANGNFPPAPGWFRHLSPLAASTSAPVFPGTLTFEERNEVNSWLANKSDAVLASFRNRAAVLKVAEFKTYYADPAYLGWADADKIARESQWRLFCADALRDNSATTAPSETDTGTGAGSPPAFEPPGTNTP